MKHLDKMTKFCFAGYLLTLSTFTLACNPGQGSGQCGYYDNSGYHNAPIGSGNSGSSYGNNYAPSSPRVIIVPNRYGAIARSRIGHIGISGNMDSMKDATAVAMRNCKRGPSPEGCEITAWTRNGCVAASMGKNNEGYYWSFTGANDDESSVIKEVMESCEAAGFSECQILDLICSIH